MNVRMMNARERALAIRKKDQKEARRLAEERIRQEFCNHFKKRRNYVSYTFIHHMSRYGEQLMQFMECSQCKMEWYPWDTSEILFRDGVYLDNYTHLGWREVAMIVHNETTTLPDGYKHAYNEKGEVMPKVTSVTTEVATFDDGTSILRQRPYLHEGTGLASVTQPDFFRALFAVGSTTEEIKERIANPEGLPTGGDGRGVGR